MRASCLGNVDPVAAAALRNRDTVILGGGCVFRLAHWGSAACAARTGSARSRRARCEVVLPRDG
jgi:hypothetical protein